MRRARAWWNVRRPRLTVDRKADMAYLSLPGRTGLLRTVDLGYGLYADLDIDTGRVVGIEVHLDHTTRTVEVTSTDVQAAQLVVKLRRELGKPVPRAVQMIADAKPEGTR